MDTSFFDALRQLIHDKGIPQELVLQAVEKGLLAAYKRKFHTEDNAVVQSDPESGNIRLFSRREVVAEVESEVFDISLEEAQQLNPAAEIGDEILIEQHLEDFGRIAAQTARQQIIQKLKDIEKNIIYEEFISRKGELINGYFQREKNGIIFVNLGKTEGILPKSHQSPRENFHIGDGSRPISTMWKTRKTGRPRSSSPAAAPVRQKLFEMEVPEIYDGIVQIKGIVRAPGFRTKIAVQSNRDEIDPVGTCVGMKGVRIQAIIREIEGEKIDISSTAATCGTTSRTR
jgi:N utilization substance protein A